MRKDTNSQGSSWTKSNFQWNSIRNSQVEHQLELGTAFPTFMLNGGNMGVKESIFFDINFLYYFVEETIYSSIKTIKKNRGIKWLPKILMIWMFISISNIFWFGMCWKWCEHTREVKRIQELCSTQDFSGPNFCRKTSCDDGQKNFQLSAFCVFWRMT